MKNLIPTRYTLLGLLTFTLSPTQATQPKTNRLAAIQRCLTTTGALWLAAKTPDKKSITTTRTQQGHTYTFYTDSTVAVTGPFGEDLGTHPTNNPYPKPHQTITLEKQGDQRAVFVGLSLLGGCYRCDKHDCTTPDNCLHGEETKEQDPGDTNLLYTGQAGTDQSEADEYQGIINDTFRQCGTYKKSNQPAVIVLGTTGVGKSTSIASFLGYKMIQKKDPRAQQQMEYADFLNLCVQEHSVKEKKIIDLDIDSLKNTYPDYIDDLTATSLDELIENHLTRTHPNYAQKNEKEKKEFQAKAIANETYKQAGTLYLSGICPRIGHKATSCTLLPKRYEAQNQNLCLYDFAGFEDNRGDKISFQVTLGSNLILSQVDEIQALLLVVSHDDVLDQQDTRHTKLNDQIFKVLDELTKMQTHQAKSLAQAIIQTSEKKDLAKREEVLSAIKKKYPILNNLFILFNKVPEEANQITVSHPLSRIYGTYMKEKQNEYKSIVYLFYMLLAKHTFVCKPLQDHADLLEAVKQPDPISRKAIGFIGKKDVVNNIVLIFQSFTQKNDQTIQKAIALYQKIQHKEDIIRRSEVAIQEKEKALVQHDQAAIYASEQITRARDSRNKSQQLEQGLSTIRGKIELLEQQLLVLPEEELMKVIDTCYYEKSRINFTEYNEHEKKVIANRNIVRYEVKTGSQVELIEDLCEDYETGRIWYKIRANGSPWASLEIPEKMVTVRVFYFDKTRENARNELKTQINARRESQAIFSQGIEKVNNKDIDSHIDNSNNQKNMHLIKMHDLQKDIKRLQEDIDKANRLIEAQRTQYNHMYNQITHKKAKDTQKALKSMLSVMPKDRVKRLEDYVQRFDKFTITYNLSIPPKSRPSATTTNITSNDRSAGTTANTTSNNDRPSATTTNITSNDRSAGTTANTTSNNDRPSATTTNITSNDRSAGTTANTTSNNDRPSATMTNTNYKLAGPKTYADYKSDRKLPGSDCSIQ